MATQDTYPMTDLPHPVFEISISATEFLSGFPERSWTIHLENTRTGRKSSRFTLIDPFSRVEYDELRWYMEIFAFNDPFSSDRAARIAQSQTRYGKSLVATLRPYINEIDIRQGKCIPESSLGALHFLVFGDGTTNSLHSLIWELVERDECCQPAVSITVSRMSKGALMPSHSQVSDLRYPLRILYVSARPALVEDVAYRAISRLIWDLVEADAKNPPKVAMEFVRPGTWAMFRNVLKSRGPGFFDIVHFDTHGTIRRRAGKDTAYLHFSSQGAATTKPDPKFSRQIAQELAKYEVRSVILNSCNAATAGSSEDSNLAHILASHGMDYVIAMAYAVKTDAAAFAMRTLYSNLFTDRENPLKAVRCTRAKLRLKRGRTGRYGMTVLCDDEFNLVCYLAESGSGMARHVADFTEAAVLSHATGSMDISSKSTSKSGEEALGIDAPTIERIQDLDTLSIEELLVGNDVVFVTGESGTGKSTLACHLQEWWKRTAFARDVEYFDALPDIDRWLEGSHKPKSLLSSSAEKLGNHTTKPLMEGGIHDYDQIILFDNVESWDTLLREDIKKEEPSRMSNLIEHCQQSPGKRRMIFFTRITEEVLSSRFPSTVIHEVCIPTVEEATTIAAHYLSEQMPLSQAGAADLEDLIKHHRMNLAFLHIFIRHMAQLKIQPKDLIAHLVREPGACNFGNFKQYIEAKGSGAAVFKLVHDHVQAWSQEHWLSFRMFFPFCMFHCRIPQDVKVWFHKLYEKGLFTGGRPMAEPFPMESGKIHFYDIEGWETFPPDWHFEQNWMRVRDCLETGGLIQKERAMPGATEQYFRAHPLLPYFLRYEITQLPLKDPQRYWSLLSLAYWEYHEVRANSLTLSWLGKPSDRYSILMNINSDVINLAEAVRLTVEQPCFAFRIMRVYNLIPHLNYTSMRQGQLRQWAFLLDQVLARFERIYLEKEWSDKPSQDLRQSLLLYSMQIAERRGLVFEKLGRSKAVIDNTERAIRLKKKFTQDLRVPTNDAIEATFYITQAQRAKAIPSDHWSSADLELFEKLLITRLPDGLLPNGARMKVARAELANRLADEKKNLPESHPLHAMIEESFQEGIVFIQSIFREESALSQHLPLGARTAITYPAGQESIDPKSVLDGYISGQNIIHAYRSIQEDFLKRVPSNDPGYSGDARAYTVDTDALLRQDKFVFHRSRLRRVYEIALQQKDSGNQAFCLEHLSTAAIIDGDLGAADQYFKAWKRLGLDLVNDG